MNLILGSLRLPSIFLFTGILVVAGCKTAPPQFADAQFQYTVKPGDTWDSIASAYKKQGVDVWPDTIQMANESLNSTTNLSPGASIIVPARNCIVPKLIEPIEFDGYTVSQINSSQAARYLMSQKIKSFSSQFLKSADGAAIVTETVLQYIAADKTKVYAATTVDMVAEDLMRSIKAKLEFMAKAQPSVRSYLTSRYFKSLPVDVLISSLNASEGDVSDKYEKILKAEAKQGKTLNDYTRPWAPLHVTHQVWGSDTELRFTDSTMEIDYYIKEVARGDWNGDGIEDAFIEIGWHTQGTRGGSYTTIVTRTGPDQSLKWVATP